jgi:hypothetical protein
MSSLTDSPPLCRDHTSPCSPAQEPTGLHHFLGGACMRGFLRIAGNGWPGGNAPNPETPGEFTISPRARRVRGGQKDGPLRTLPGTPSECTKLRGRCVRAARLLAAEGDAHVLSVPSITCTQAVSN